MFYSIAVLVLSIDQLSKYWIRSHIKVGDSFELWKGILSITHYENSGAAFSSFQGYGRFFVPVAVFIVFAIIYYRKGGTKKRLIQELGSGLLVGGALGNMIDRILYNQVTDFISFHFNHGILNISDYSINFGMIFILLDMLVNHSGREKLHCLK